MQHAREQSSKLGSHLPPFLSLLFLFSSLSSFSSLSLSHRAGNRAFTRTDGRTDRQTLVTRSRCGNKAWMNRRESPGPPWSLWVFATFVTRNRARLIAERGTKRKKKRGTFCVRGLGRCSNSFGREERTNTVSRRTTFRDTTRFFEFSRNRQTVYLAPRPIRSRIRWPVVYDLVTLRRENRGRKVNLMTFRASANRRFVTGVRARSREKTKVRELERFLAF